MDTKKRALEGAKARWRNHKKVEWAVVRVPRPLLTRLQEINPSKAPWQVIEGLLEVQYSAEAR